MNAAQRSAASASALAGMLFIGCQPAAESTPVGMTRHAIVYGADDRREAVDSPELPWIVALVPRDVLSVAADGGALASFEGVHETCPGERFAEQPAIAQCSGVLLAPGLLVTAAHCMDLVESCQDYVYVKNYHYLADGGLPDQGEFVTMECETTLVRVKSSLLDERQLDFALVRLAAPDPALVPPRVRRRPAVVGEVVTTLGASGGLPFKASSGAVRGVSAQGGYFELVADVYVGGSGSGVFDQEGSLLGIHVRGGADFEFTTDGCWRSRTVAEDGTGGTEHANDVISILESLCQVEPDNELCFEAPVLAAPPDDGEGEVPWYAKPSATAATMFPSEGARVWRGPPHAEPSPDGPEMHSQDAGADSDTPQHLRPPADSCQLHALPGQRSLPELIALGVLFLLGQRRLSRSRRAALE